MTEKVLPSVESYEVLARAAFAGDSAAQFLMGECYRLGYYGLSTDDTVACRWYERAAQGGNHRAIFLLNNWRNRSKFHPYE